MKIHTTTAVLIALLCRPAPSDAQVAATKHNLSVSGPGTIKASSEQQICVFCHTPHKASSVAQLWNRSQPSTVYTLYSSDYLTSKAYGSPVQINAKSKLCMSCHDGTIALGAVINAPGGGVGPISMSGGITTMPTGSGGHLGAVLSDDHPVGFGYDPARDPELVNRAFPWNSSVKLDPDASNGTVECHTCHDPHDNQYTRFLRMSNSNAALCTWCHNKTDWTTSVHDNSTQSYTPPGGSATTIGEWACRNCHKPHSGGGSPYILQSSEQNTCYQSGCHGSTWTGGGTTDIQSQMSKTFAHPTNTISGRHKDPDNTTSLADRHAECPDCHDPHKAVGTLHDGTSRNISGVLKGTWGVEPSPWPAAPTGMVNNNNTYAIPSSASYIVRDPATTEYQVCLKCHSNYVTQPVGQRNLGAEINPTYPSYHGIVAGGISNIYCDATTMNEPWGTNKIVICSDCHGSNTAGDPKGPHGSNLDNILVATITSDATNGTPLCFVCHKINNYWTGQTRSGYSEHPGAKPSHQLAMGCFSCHMYDFSSYGATTGGNSRAILVHGQNRRWYYAEYLTGRPAAIAQSPTKHYCDAFVNGYLADVDFVNRRCWTEQAAGEFATNCGHTHSGQAYSIDP